MKVKGPGRVMIYFCTRDYPSTIDLTEVGRVREFKKEIGNYGLYHEYKTVEQFERDLYHHLDQKVKDFLLGKLPEPVATPTGARSATNEKPLPADPRLHSLIEFGSSLPSIATAFEQRLAEFAKIDGGGQDKYLALGSHVLNSVASGLDRFLEFSASEITAPDKRVLENLSMEAKRLGTTSNEYLKKGFPLFWSDAEKIASDLKTHVDYLKNIGRI
jgi:hypothetical protein